MAAIFVQPLATSPVKDSPLKDSTLGYNVATNLLHQLNNCSNSKQLKPDIFLSANKRSARKQAREQNENNTEIITPRGLTATKGDGVDHHIHY